MSKTEFLAAVRSARAELLEVLERTDAETLATARVPGLEWTAKDVLSHLIGYDLAIVDAANARREGRPFTWPWTYPDFDAWNERNVAPRRARPLAAVRGELQATRLALLGELERWPEDAGPFGPTSWDAQKSEISWLAPHEREHAEMIAKLGASGTR